MATNNLDIDTLAGQRLMAGFNGTRLNDEIKYLIRDLRVGGMILFAGNVENPEQVALLCRESQAFARQCNCPPLFLAIDQEGGQVARLKAPLFKEFQGAPKIDTLEKAETMGRQMAQLLSKLNLNMNLAPVMDTVPSGFRGIMNQRVFKGDPQTVAKLGMGVIRGLQNNGVMAVAKHFPGIGRTTLDSHLHLPILDTTEQVLMQSDLVPFKVAIENKVSGVMLSHILYSCLDPGWPASLSPGIAKAFLRDRMGYRGLVVTDDLDMQAIKHDIKICVHQILKAHIDMFLICHSGPDIDTAVKETRRLLSQNPSMHDSGTASVKRILNAKKQYLVGG
ncbi:beta-N-acetylhexosaminidase [Desulfocicer vacuolatum DSM 3385]|uniref:beta-N-acetylhexosaminidase n=1 Tax=Desulfocicer vacuolatum DSM 3385 TaxID=1121400 RepID=A0A1W2E1R1_9BACT|nr:glycoside hydrolase family 3 N-terminal domain-containing protein [Desulfocicer vacuolatum]SMD03703.1 beta-N-acetylhexosaminidase [Desulfocicer vacuolatum DSM 3385]